MMRVGVLKHHNLLINQVPHNKINTIQFSDQNIMMSYSFSEDNPIVFKKKHWAYYDIEAI